MQTPLLQIPVKKTDDVDFAQPFSDYIAEAYSDDPNKYQGELATLNRLRHEATTGLTFDTYGRDKIYRYYGQLELLDLRFPIEESKVNILFNWFDAFTDTQIAQHSIAYEKASTIFNIAAACSSIAAAQNRLEPGFLKVAFNYFQCSAGLFQYVNDNFLHAPSKDLSRDSINVIKDLMLAQAQEVLIEKVTQFDKKSGMIVAKLAAQCAFMYQSILAELTKTGTELEGQFEKSWSDLARIKNKYFSALAHYHKTVVDSGKYGQDVAHLMKAELLAKESLKLSTAFGPSQVLRLLGSSSDKTAASIALQESARVLLNQITSKKLIAIKENDLIYHDPVPGVESLAVIDKVSAVKCIAFADICTNGASDIPNIIGPDIFHKLVPLSVHESSSMYSEEKAKILRIEQSRCLSANQDLDVALDSMHVVPTLQKLKTSLKNGDIVGFHLSEEAVGWCRLVRESSDSDELVTVLNSVKNRVLSCLDETGMLLDKVILVSHNFQEQHEGETQRSRYGGKWRQSLSSTMTQNIRADMRKHRDSYEKALTADGQLVSRFSQSKRVVDILRQPRESVESIFAAAVSESEGANLIDAGAGFIEIGEQVSVDKLEGLVGRLKGLKKERAELLDDLKHKIHNDDISSLLLLNKNKESQVFQAELLKFKTHSTRIQSNLTLQTTLLNETSKEVEKIVTTSQTYKNLDNREKKRYQVLKDWKRNFDSWKGAYDGLARGVQFYTDLAEITEALRRSVVSFYNSRTEERNNLIKDIDSEQAAMGQRVLREQMQRLNIQGAGNGMSTYGSPTSPTVVPSYSSRPAPPTSQPYTAQAHNAYSPSNSAHLTAPYIPQVTPTYTARSVTNATPYSQPTSIPSYNTQQSTQPQYQSQSPHPVYNNNQSQQYNTYVPPHTTTAPYTQQPSYAPVPSTHPSPQYAVPYQAVAGSQQQHYPNPAPTRAPPVQQEQYQQHAYTQQPGNAPPSSQFAGHVLGGYSTLDTTGLYNVAGQGGQQLQQYGYARPQAPPPIPSKVPAYRPL